VRRLGILAVDLNDQLRSIAGNLRISSGVVVIARAVDLIGPETGLKTGDVIHSVNTTPVNSLDSLRAVLDALKPSAPVVLQVERQGQLQWLAFEMD
jgi:serine protease Do